MALYLHTPWRQLGLLCVGVRLSYGVDSLLPASLNCRLTPLWTARARKWFPGGIVKGELNGVRVYLQRVGSRRSGSGSAAVPSLASMVGFSLIFFRLPGGVHDPGGHAAATASSVNYPTAREPLAKAQFLVYSQWTELLTMIQRLVVFLFANRIHFLAACFNHLV